MRTVLLTGAAGGMGRATTHVLLERGWRVLALDHHAERLHRLTAGLAGQPVVPVLADLTSPELIARVSPHLDGTLTGLVNLAGISEGARIERLTDAAWRRSFAVNVDAPMRLARACAPHLALTRGSIVNVGSPVGTIGTKKPSYAASKAALHGLTMSLARNLGPQGVRANLLLPGTAITHMTDDWSAERRADIAKGLFLGRLAEPVEIGRVIAFLLSDDASYMSGSVVDMTCGGMVGH